MPHQSRDKQTAFRAPGFIEILMCVCKGIVANLPLNRRMTAVVTAHAVGDFCAVIEIVERVAPLLARLQAVLKHRLAISRYQLLHFTELPQAEAVLVPGKIA